MAVDEDVVEALPGLSGNAHLGMVDVEGALDVEGPEGSDHLLRPGEGEDELLIIDDRASLNGEGAAAEAGRDDEEVVVCDEFWDLFAHETPEGPESCPLRIFCCDCVLLGRGGGACGRAHFDAVEVDGAGEAWGAPHLPG